MKGSCPILPIKPIVKELQKLVTQFGETKSPRVSSAARQLLSKDGTFEEIRDVKDATFILRSAVLFNFSDPFGFPVLQNILEQFHPRTLLAQSSRDTPVLCIQEQLSKQPLLSNTTSYGINEEERAENMVELIAVTAEMRTIVSHGICIGYIRPVIHIVPLLTFDQLSTVLKAYTTLQIRHRDLYDSLAAQFLVKMDSVEPALMIKIALAYVGIDMIGSHCTFSLMDAVQRILRDPQLRLPPSMWVRCLSLLESPFFHSKQETVHGIVLHVEEFLPLLDSVEASTLDVPNNFSMWNGYTILLFFKYYPKIFDEDILKAMTKIVQKKLVSADLTFHHVAQILQCIASRGFSVPVALLSCLCDHAEAQLSQSGTAKSAAMIIYALCELRLWDRSLFPKLFQCILADEIERRAISLETRARSLACIEFLVLKKKWEAAEKSKTLDGSCTVEDVKDVINPSSSKSYSKELNEIYQMHLKKRIPPQEWLSLVKDKMRQLNRGY